LCVHRSTAPLIYIGPINYVTVMGAPETVQGYRMHRPLTREQFVDAIHKGFELVRYRKRTRRVKEHRLISSGFRAQTANHMADKVEIVPVPVR